MTRKAGATRRNVLALVLCLGGLGASGLAAEAATPRADIRIGNPAPAFNLQTLDGKTVSIESFKGKVVLIDFWATWCGPCRKALPELKDLRQRNAREPLVVVSVSADEDRKTAAEFARQNGMDWLQAWDGQGKLMYGVLGISELPAYVLIDAQGRIAYLQRGWAPMSSAALLGQAVSRALETACKPNAAADKPC